jgi:hypothetical protein
MKRFGTVTVLALATTLGACNVSTPTSPSMSSGGAAPLMINYTETGGGSNSSGILSDSDRNFAAFLASWNRSQIELGILAERLADRDLIEYFGFQMIQESTLALEQLDEISGIRLSQTGMDATHLQFHTALSRMSGSAFDRMYMPMMVQSLLAFQQEILRMNGSSTATTLRAHANDTLVQVNAQLAFARQLSTDVD